ERAPDSLPKRAGGQVRRTQVSWPTGLAGDGKCSVVVLARNGRSLLVVACDQVGPKVEHETVLIHATVQRQPVRRFLGGSHVRHGAAPAAEHREQSPEIHHLAAVSRVEIVPCVVEGPDVKWRSMYVNHEDPAKSLIAELTGQVDESGAQSR